MAIGFGEEKIAEDSLPFSPRRLREETVPADVLELRLCAPTTIFEVDVRLGTREALDRIPSEGGVWEGTIPLERKPELGPDDNYIEGKGPENISEGEARKRYARVKTQIEAGDYIAHKFNDGTLKIELIQ